MKIYLLKRNHHEGQTIYGAFDKESTAWSMQKQLSHLYPRVPLSAYEVVEVELNELTEVDVD